MASKSKQSFSALPLYQSALEAHKRGDLKQASLGYQKALSKDPRHAPSLHLLGLIEKEQGNREGFYRRTRAALNISPTYAVAWSNLANALREENKLDESEEAARRAIALDESLAEAWNTLGLISHQRGEFPAALEQLKKANELNPNSLDFQSNLATALHASGDDQAAEALYKKVLGADTSRPRTCNNYGVMLKDQAETELAIQLYRHAVARDATYSDAHWNLALALLSQGNYSEGWAEYEWRWSRSDNIERRPEHPFEAYRSGIDIQGKKLFVYGEQGMGDTLQFTRYALILSRQATVCLAPQRALIPLFESQRWANVQTVSLEAVPADCDFALPLMSIPHLFPEWAERPRYDGPYLVATRERATRTASVFETNRFNVGLCWQGSKNKIDKGRSIALKELVPITQVQGVRAYSLQRKDGVEQLSPPPENIALRVFDDQFDADGAFLDTAAVITHLDLVITTDTAMAHLAGAMGKEVWLLLQFVPDWRWGLQGDTTAWYPRTRIYRQLRPGDWPEVIQRLRNDLAQRVRIKLEAQT